MSESASSAYAPPAAPITPKERTSRVNWLVVLAASGLGALGPALVVDAHIGWPIFKGAQGVLELLTYVVFCVVLAAFAILGMWFVAGKRIPAALFLGLAVLPACVGFFGWAKVLASREQLPDLDAETASSLLRFVADIARPIAAFGLASSGCALLVVGVLAILSHRTALAHRGLDSNPVDDGGTARGVGAVVIGLCPALVPLYFHPTMVESVLFHGERWFDETIACGSLAVVAACVLGAAAAGVLARRLHLLALVQDDRERGWLWRRAALVPLSAALAVACFELSMFFAAGGRDGGFGVAVFEAGLVLVAGILPLLCTLGPRRAGLRTVGAPFALSSAVLLASIGGLTAAAAHLASTQAELARLHEEAIKVQQSRRSAAPPTYRNDP
jgi:hypothetical protein